MRKQRDAAPDIIDNLRRIFQIVSEYSKMAERSTGLTGPQLWALNILSNAAPLHVSDLAHLMHLSPATVVGILDRLEAKGLVIRIRSKEDRRVVDLHLTEKGLDVAAKSPEVAQVMLMKGLEELSDEQFYRVDEGMQQIVRILGAEHLTPQPLHG
ncbi:MAG: MarR family transcriptional regulator [Geobacteraceae bacterium]|nr:MarR family transcriptional regulator [Geobacteraceae bacterium]NTW79129.1 MarR family transcriptional regulator [Geobacteraceae bacterium]